jgi:hypothetical protein
MPVTQALGCASTDCSSCQAAPCPPIACAISSPLPAAGIDVSWSGVEWTSGGACGNYNTPCSKHSCAAAGRYTARFCGYALSGGDGGFQDCQLFGSSTPTCADVAFDYPTTSVVTGVLDPRK